MFTFISPGGIPFNLVALRVRDVETRLDVFRLRKGFVFECFSSNFIVRLGEGLGVL